MCVKKCVSIFEMTVDEPLCLWYYKKEGEIDWNQISMFYENMYTGKYRVNYA